MSSSRLLVNLLLLAFSTVNGLSLGSASKCSKTTRRALIVGASSSLFYQQLLRESPVSAVINGASVSNAEAARSGTVALWIDLNECEVCRHDVPAACSGVLLGPRLVLSAQHCLDIPESLGGHLSRVVFGSDMFDTTATSIDVLNYVKPADVGLDISSSNDKNNNSLQNDLLLIKLKSDAPKNWNIATIVTPTEQYSRFNLYGYGDTRDDSDDYTSGTLRRIQLVAISALDKQTSSFYSMPLNKDSGTCNGDSGGPALVTSTRTSTSSNTQLLGILSSNTMPCTGSNAIFMNPVFFTEFLRRASAKLNEPLDLYL